MSPRFFLIAAVVVSVSAGLSPAQPPTVAQREAMKKLDFLVGQWQGDGWMEFVPGQRRTFKGTEVVRTKLDGLVLTIDGVHRGQVGGKGEEVVVHNAFAVVRYDDKAKAYRFQGFTARGNHEETQAEVTDRQLVWGLKVPQFGDMRYTIKLDDKGRWFEIGEVSQDGKEWRKFFEMTLERVESKQSGDKSRVPSLDERYEKIVAGIRKLKEAEVVALLGPAQSMKRPVVTEPGRPPADRELGWEATTHITVRYKDGKVSDVSAVFSEHLRVERVTPANFRRIQVGLTQKQVVDILGDRYAMAPAGDGVGDHWGATSSITLYFDKDGLLVSQKRSVSRYGPNTK